MRAGKHGILGRMAEIKDMYRIVKIIDEQPLAKKLIKDKSSDFSSSIYAFREYVKKYGLKSRGDDKEGDEMIKVFVMADRKGYIEEIENEDSAGIFITDSGYHLIAKKWKFIPIGLIDESLKAYGSTVALLVGGGAGAIILYVVQLIFGNN